MKKVVHMEEHLKEKDFNEQVLPFFNMLQTHYNYTKESNSAMFSMMHKYNYLYVFLEYVPRNIFTERPNITDRFFNIKTNPRDSKGEWVVYKIYEIGSEYHSFLQSLDNDNLIDNSHIAYIHNEIQK